MVFNVAVCHHQRISVVCVVLWCTVKTDKSLCNQLHGHSLSRSLQNGARAKADVLAGELPLKGATRAHLLSPQISWKAGGLVHKCNWTYPLPAWWCVEVYLQLLKHRRPENLWVTAGKLVQQSPVHLRITSLAMLPLLVALSCSKGRCCESMARCKTC